MSGSSLTQDLPLPRLFAGGAGGLLWPQFMGAKYQTEPIPKMMTYQNIGRRKPGSSDHQRQIRLLTGLLMGVCALITFVFFWLVNRPSFIPH
jgi:hypothetical protein